MIGTVKITERGPTPRHMLKAHNAAAKDAWERTGVYWFGNFLEKHFTEAGAREYNYTRRKGEGLTPGTARFNRSYTGRKLREKGHTRPLEYSGRSRQQARRARVSSTSKGGKVTISAPTLNLRHPKSRIVMREELARISRAEGDQLARVFDRRYDVVINGQGGSTTNVV